MINFIAPNIVIDPYSLPQASTRSIPNQNQNSATPPEPIALIEEWNKAIDWDAQGILISSEKKIDPAMFYYHTPGFDLYKIQSILKHGILSYQEAQNQERFIDSFGKGENGHDRISLSTWKLLQRRVYTGIYPSFIVDPNGLNFLPQTAANNNWIPEERQTFTSILPEKFIGIMIPDNFLAQSLKDLQVIISLASRVEVNICNLDICFSEFLGQSLISSPEFNPIYKDKDSCFNRHLSGFDSLSAIKINEYKLKKINQAIMAFFLRAWKDKFGIEPRNAVEIIQFFTGGKIPCYNIKGELLNSLPLIRL